ncbi:MAG: ECF transporter S component [Coriobacteriia bacterium]|nr:ECF transporter S component [Coriobacteriia bacterium]MCL2870581.1 ECF transporter S component [Coriobacteriia bacterium]
MTKREQTTKPDTEDLQGTPSQSKSRTQLLVVTGLLTALVFVVTRFLGIPMPFDVSGWLNLGDSSIAASALLLPHPLVALAAGFGSALSNLTSGHLIFAPATLVIKGSMGYVLYLFVKKGKFSWYVLGVFLAELIMVAGYTAYIFLIVDVGSLASIPGNLFQAGANFILALLLYAPLMALRKALWGSGSESTSAVKGTKSASTKKA